MKLKKRVTTLVFILVLVAMSDFAHGAAVRVNWNPNSETDLNGYKVYYGTLSGTYTQVVDAGLQTSTDVSNLSEGRTYYFAVTAYDVSGNESSYSNEASIAIPSEDTGDSGGETPGDPNAVDTDRDGIPDEMEDEWGLNPYDPMDSLLDDDGDGVETLVEYMAGTSPVDPGSYPLSDNVLKDLIGELGETIDLSSLNPDGTRTIVPLDDTFPTPVNNAVTPGIAGTYLYNVRDVGSSLIYRLRVSVTEQLAVMGSYEPGTYMELTDQASGIKIDIPANALIRPVPIGIGNVVSESASFVEPGQGILFDILPFGLTLANPALVTVCYEGGTPSVQRYDSEIDSWVDLEESTTEDGQVSFSADVLGTFRVLSEQVGSAPVADGGGGGGGCFIQTAGF